MNKSFVKTQYGRFVSGGNKQEYKNAKSIQHMGYLKRRPIKYFAIRYKCKECTKLKKLDK